MIRQLSSQLEQQRKAPNIREETKIAEEIPIQMHTRSQGPANTGQEIVQEIFDQHGNLIWKGMEFKLAGKPYSAADFILNLIKPNISNQIKAFKNAIRSKTASIRRQDNLQ